MSIAVVVPTHNRLHLFRKCVARVLAVTSDETEEILLWDNGCTDGTGEFLDELDDPRIRVVHHPENIGLNAFKRAYALTTAPYLVGLDEDVVDAPAEWDRRLLEALRRLPDVGYLATNLVHDSNDPAARRMYGGDHADLYTSEEVNGVKLKVGPVGGWCAMTSRETYDAVGGLPEKKFVYWHHDNEYIKRIAKIGLRPAILEDVAVHHAGGPFYSRRAPEKAVYYRARAVRQARRDRVKSLLLALPFVARLNGRHGWFEPPPLRP